MLCTLDRTVMILQAVLVDHLMLDQLVHTPVQTSCVVGPRQHVYAEQADEAIFGRNIFNSTCKKRLLTETVRDCPFRHSNRKRATAVIHGVLGVRILVASMV